MKKIGLIVFIAALTVGSILSASFNFGSFSIFGNFRGVRGSGNLRNETRDVSDFKEIKAGGAVNLEVVAQNDFNVSVEADDNLLQYIKTETDGDTLKIYTENNINPKSRINVRISMPELNSIDLSGASTANVSNVSSNSLTLEASGASKIKIDGTAKTLKSEASGASNVDASGLTVEDADVEANGASKTIVSATNDLKADASGASTIYYTGEPRNIEKNSSGASSVKKK